MSLFPRIVSGRETFYKDTAPPELIRQAEMLAEELQGASPEID